MKTFVHWLAVVTVVVGLTSWGSRHVQAQATAPTVTEPASSPDAVKTETRAKFGTTLLYAHRYEQAISEFKKVLAMAPDNYEARFGLARAYFWTQRVREAAETLKPLVEKGATQEVALLWNDIASASGNTLIAIKALDTAIKASPEDVKLSLSKARLLTASGCYVPAIRMLKELNAKHPSNSEIQRALAHAYFTADRYPEATEIYKGLVDAQQPVGLEAKAELARILLKTLRLPEAKEALMRMRTEDASDPRPDLGLLAIWTLDPEVYTADVDRTLKRLADIRLLARIESSDSVREWVSDMVRELLTHEGSDDSKQLAAGLAKLVEGGDTPFLKAVRQTLQQYAQDGRKGVRPDVEPFLAGIRDGSISRSAVYDLAHFLLTLATGETLVQVCDAYLALEPDDVAVMMQRAEGLAGMAQYDDSGEAYLAILDKMPENSKARRGLARNYSWARQFDLSVAQYEELISQDPTDMVIRREYARALGWDKRLRQSLEVYDKAVESLGDDPASREWKKALASERQAKHDYWWGYDRKAANEFAAIIADDPSNMEARFDLAQVYAKNRHWEEAAEEYRKIIAIESRHRRALDALYYKNKLYHEPELRVEYQWFKERGRGASEPQRYPGDPPGRRRAGRTDLVDIETCRLTETLKQEIARRTDLSLIETQMWHRFDSFHRGTFDEYQQALRLDHRFNLQTYGHISAGHAELDGTDEQDRFIGDFEITHKALDWLSISLGGIRQPYRRNWTTVKEEIDENKIYVRLAGDVDPWLDWYVQYGRSWLDKGEWWVNNRTCLVNEKNGFHELLWGANYRLSLFPKVLQLEYHGIAWWFDRDAATYWTPNPFNVHIFRQGWRHYLNNDQYFEQKQFYYEIGVTESVDSDGIGGVGYDVGLGWDLCHHFGFETKWSQTCSSTYDSRLFYIQLVARF